MPDRPLRRRLACLLFTLCCLAGARAEEAATACPPAAKIPTPEQAKAGQEQARDHGFLWRISKGGHSSWLYGTLHVGKAAWIYPGPQLKAALREADTVALELDMLDPAVLRRLTQAVQAASAPELPAPLTVRLARQIKFACLDAQALKTLSPAMQAATLVALAGRRDGLDPSYGIDPMLAAAAHRAGKKVVSLETPESQAQALGGETPEEELDFVEQTLQELESGKARPTLVRIARVWASGDLAELERYEQWCDCMNTAAERAQMHRLLDERNAGMANGIAALHSGGASVLAGVGSLHMIGSQGLPALLAARGYTVERIRFAP
ncbi:MAG TPA: TraB/GumN family protein [Methylibium sp.]